MNNTQLTLKEVQHIEQSLLELSHKLQAGLNKLSKIELYLYDDDATKSPGMVQTQRSHEKRIEKLENESMQRKKIWATIGVAAGVVGTALVEFIKWLFTNHKIN